MPYTREQIMNKLKEHIVDVTFKKVNGDIRTMPVTLIESHLPKATKDPMSQKKIREINEEVISAWCIDAEGWRSFRVANVIQLESKEPKTFEAFKEACRIFWMVKGHLGTTPQTVLDSKDSYFKRLWKTGTSGGVDLVLYEEGFEEAFEKVMKTPEWAEFVEEYTTVYSLGHY